APSCRHTADTAGPRNGPCEGVYVDFGLLATALMGTSTMPRPAAALAQCAMRSIEAGRAFATPTATPRSRALDSSFASALSISAGVGTASSTMLALANGMLAAPAIWLVILRADVPSSR